MRRQRRSGVLVALACVAVVVFAACGGSEERLSTAEYERQANEECATLEEASEALRKAQEPDAVGAEVTKHLGTAADRLRELVDALGELTPPEAIEGEVDDLLDVLEQYADRLDELGESARANQTLQEVLDANTDEVLALNELAQTSSNLVETLGLAGCMLES
jgi:tetratricopeptide (TPR) repeat protein